jgi:hypothetical protein
MSTTRSPDLNPCLLYLWAMINDNVHVNIPYTEDHLQENTHNRGVSVSPAVVERAMNHVLLMFDGRL